MREADPAEVAGVPLLAVYLDDVLTIGTSLEPVNKRNEVLAHVLEARGLPTEPVQYSPAPEVTDNGKAVGFYF